MIASLKGALSGSLESLIIGLMKSTSQYDASEIRGSIKVKNLDQTDYFKRVHCPLLEKRLTLPQDISECIWSDFFSVFSGLRNRRGNAD